MTPHWGLSFKWNKTVEDLQVQALFLHLLIIFTQINYT